MLGMDKLPKRQDLMAMIMNGVIDKTFDIPTKDAIQKVRMTLLQEKEDIECQKISGSYDLLTREKIYRREVLARAILDINNQTLGDNQVEMLRDFIDALQTPMVVRLWECYNDLRSLQILQLGDSEIKALKNSSGSPESLG